MAEERQNNVIPESGQLRQEGVVAEKSVWQKNAPQGPFAQYLAVPKAGFRWATDVRMLSTDPIEHWLVASAPMDTPSRVLLYQPMAVRDLHRRFARLRPTPEAILTFANRFGFLGHSEIVSSEAGPSEPAESLISWVSQLNLITPLLLLWELIRNREAGKLGCYFRWHGRPRRVGVFLASALGPPELLKDPVLMRSDQARMKTYAALSNRGRYPAIQAATLASEAMGEGSQDLLARWRFGDPIEPARYYVHREVNTQLRGHVSPAVLPFRQGEILFFPDCLLAAIYTHFALELSGRRRQPILCARPGCGRYFQPSNRRQVYCDASCRSLAWLDRRGEPQ
jgi:hypothetical protein